MISRSYPVKTLWLIKPSTKHQMDSFEQEISEWCFQADIIWIIIWILYEWLKSNATAIIKTFLVQLDCKNQITKKTMSDTAQTMVYSEMYRLSRQLQTVEAVADYQDSCILSGHLHTVKTSLGSQSVILVQIFLFHPTKILRSLEETYQWDAWFPTKLWCDNNFSLCLVEKYLAVCWALVGFNNNFIFNLYIYKNIYQRHQ